MLAKTLCGFLIGQSLGTGAQPLADTHGIRCCGIDQGLRDVGADAYYPKAFAMRNAAEAASLPAM
jgi:hypothetical protein